MGVPHLDSGPMTAEEFFAFTATRPDGENWELIDGEPILNASASRLHQKIAGNIYFALTELARRQNTDWEALLGIGVRLSEVNVPALDLLIRPNDALRGVECDDMIVAIEVLSPTTRDHDLRWKRKAYAGLASLQHYVVVAQDAVDIVCFDRFAGFNERCFKSADDILDLPAIRARLSLHDIYRDTGLV